MWKKVASAEGASEKMGGFRSEMGGRAPSISPDPTWNTVKPQKLKTRQSHSLMNAYFLARLLAKYYILIFTSAEGASEENLAILEAVNP